MRRWRTSAALLSLALVLVAAGCGMGGNDVVNVPLVRLVEEEDTYDGEDVRTEGVVRSFGKAGRDLHFWIEDAATNRVSVEPARLVKPVVGRRVRVEGRFESAETAGRVIELSHSPTVARG